MRIKYRIDERIAIRIIVILIAITFIFGFLPNIMLWGFLLIETAVIALVFAKKIVGKISILHFCWIISTMYIICNTRTFNSNVAFYLLYVLIGLMMLVCIEGDSCEFFYNSLKYFAIFGFFAGTTSIIEVVYPSGILALFRVFSPGELTEIITFLNNGRFLGITNYVWYTSLMLFIGGGYLISDFPNVKGKRKVGYLIILATLLIASFLSGSRSSILLFPVLVGIFYSEGKRSKYLVLGVGTLGILYFMVTHSNTSIRFIIKLQELLTKISTGDVLDVRRAGLKSLAESLFVNHKIFGIGWYEFRYYSYKWLGEHFHAHNLYFQLLAENGIIGTFVITFPWVVTCIKTAMYLRRNRFFKQGQTYRIAKFCFMMQVYLYIASFFHVTIYNGQTMLLFYFICGISLKCISLNPKGSLTKISEVE